MEALEKWHKDNGGYLHPSTKITKDASSGVHLRAATAIAPGTHVCTVPHSMALSYLNALADDAFPVFKTYRHALKIEAVGFFYLMAQYINREKSFWKPYLDTLPSPEEGYTTPLWFDDEDMLWIEGTDVQYTAVERLAIYKRYYADGIKVLQKSGIDTQPYTWNLFIWAITMYTSRSFSSQSIRPQDSKYWTTYKSGPRGRQTVLINMSHVPAEDLDFPVLFPVMDVANHGMESHVDWAFDPGRFSLTTQEILGPGDEVLNNYGPKPNDELLMGYGFCLPGNRHDRVLLTLKAPSETLQVFLRESHAGYFDASANWDPVKATFRVQRFDVREESCGSTAIFEHLPEALLELFLYIILDERSRLPGSPIASPTGYLLQESYGRRYLPHIARKLVESLVPKLSKIADALPPDAIPRNAKQSQSSTYRAGQMDIMQSVIAPLRLYLRTLRPAADTTNVHDQQSYLLTIEEALGMLRSEDRKAYDDFMRGVEANTNSSDPSTLVQAGWEDELWVLFLCFAALQYGHVMDSACTKSSNVHQWMSSLEQEYDVPGKSAGSPEAVPPGMMDLVRTAQADCAAASVWNDAAWSEGFVSSWAGKILRCESMMMRVAGVDGEERPRLVLYLRIDG